ncbi:hypothetical protein IMCC21906_00130 [Spongiibacter sp. IMCC21906]|nr:hypothetical protein IMCC21906_00130 [Spongiibacter sp. IMCC21906]
MCGGVLDTGSEAGMTTKGHDEQKALHNFRHPRCTLHTSILKAPSTLCRPRRVLHTPSSRTRQRAGIQLLDGMFYLRQIVNVRRSTGYRLGGRYDRKSSDATLRNNDVLLTTNSPVIPDAISSRDPVARWNVLPQADSQCAEAYWIPARRPV